MTNGKRLKSDIWKGVLNMRKYRLTPKARAFYAELLLVIVLFAIIALAGGLEYRWDVLGR